MSSLQLEEALEILLAPVATDDWPNEVNRRLLPLLGADVIIFRLSNRRPAWVDPAEDARAARHEYRLAFRPIDPWARQMTRPGEAVVQTAESLLGHEFERTRYFSDFMLPHNIHDYVGIQVGTMPGAHAHIGVYHIGGRRLSEEKQRRLVQLLRTVLPAIQSGVRIWRAVRPGMAEVGAMLDEFSDAIVISDEYGRELHANRAMVRHYRADPEADRLRRATSEVAREMAAARGRSATERLATVREREVFTARGAYRIRSLAADGLLEGPPMLVSVVDATTFPNEVSEHGLVTASEDFGLTSREMEVARRLARGESNSEIAAGLGIAPNTAQTHTKRVLAKLGVRSRAAVHSKLSR